MLTLPPSVKIYLAVVPTDLRRGFDGLAGLVTEVLEENPYSGHLFVFRNRRGNRCKILFWDTNGYCMIYKRLERGVFRFPSSENDSIRISSADLLLLLEGIDLAGSRRRKRFEPKIATRGASP